ncbi:MAG TPA: hypothetical protein VFD58_23885 [Blastocatellia bacterium]|nr:hypothetical protein [Blastocatellia bacterium]
MNKMTTALALIAATVMLSTMAFGQTTKRNRHGNPGIQGCVAGGRNFDISGTLKSSGARQRNSFQGGDPDRPVVIGRAAASARQRNFVSGLYHDAVAATPAGGNYTFARSRGRQGR